MKYAFGIPPVEAFGLGPLPETHSGSAEGAHIVADHARPNRYQ
jgi:hypothetical protein